MIPACLPQIPGAELMPASETSSAMIMAATSGTVDYICTDMPTAMGACAVYDNLVLLDFTGSEDNFQVDQGEINIGISVISVQPCIRLMSQTIVSYSMSVAVLGAQSRK